MQPNLAFVLRTGRAYDAGYLDFLARALVEHKVEARVWCLTDLPTVPSDWNRVELAHGWPHWWAKLELMRPDFCPGETVHFIDADTFILGDLKEFLAIDKLAMLMDFYRRDRYGSGVMVLPAPARAAAWAKWNAGKPEFLMKRHQQFGDQGFLQDAAWKSWPIAQLQRELPADYIRSYKRTNATSLATKILCCHGSPKPRELGWTHAPDGKMPWGKVDQQADTVAIVADGPSAAELRGVSFPPDVYVLAVNGAVEWLKDAPSGFFTLDPSMANRRRLREQRQGTRYYAAVSEGFGQANSRVLGYRTPLEPNVTWLHRIEGKEDRSLRSRHGLSADPRGVHTGNSCWGALGVAKHLGAKRIVIFGLDANQEKRTSGGSPGGLQHLPRLFASAVPDLEGIEVVNASAKSRVTCWPRCTVAEGLAKLGATPVTDEQRERDKYERMWERDSYRERSPGMRVLGEALKELAPEVGASFFDFGCGHGFVVEALEKLGHATIGVDIAHNAKRTERGQFVVANLWDLPATLGAREYGYCTDVLEHIPEQHIEAALRCMGSKVRRKLYFQLALFHDHCGDEIGETLHMTVKPAAWWTKKLQTAFGVEARVTATDKYVQAVVPGLST